MIYNLILLFFIFCFYVRFASLSEGCESSSDNLNEANKSVSEISALIPSIAEFLPIPQSQLRALNREYRSMFTDTFSYSYYLSTRFNIHGLVDDKELIWFDGMYGFRNMQSLFIKALERALIVQNQFPVNEAVISRYLFNLISKTQSKRIYDLCDFCNKTRNYALLIEIIDSTESIDFTKIYAIILQSEKQKQFFKFILAQSNSRKIFGKLLFRLKGDILLFSDFFASLICLGIVKNETISRIVSADLRLISDLFSIISSRLFEEFSPPSSEEEFYKTNLELFENLKGKNVQDSENALDIWLFSNAIRFGPQIEDDLLSEFSSRAGSFNEMQLNLLAAAASASNRLELFSVIISHPRASVYKELYSTFQEWSRRYVSPAFVFHVIDLAEEDQIDQLYSSKEFMNFIFKYFDIIGIWQSEDENESRDHYLSLTFTVKAENMTYFDFADFEYRFKTSSNDGLIEHLFGQLLKYPDNFEMVMSDFMQIPVCAAMFYTLPPEFIGAAATDVFLKRLSESGSIKKFFKAVKCKFPVRPSSFSQLLDGSIEGLNEVIECKQTLELIKYLYKDDQFSKLEEFNQKSLPDLVIPLIHKFNASDSEVYMKIRSALRYIKKRYLERILEIPSVHFIKLLEMETSHI